MEIDPNRFVVRTVTLHGCTPSKGVQMKKFISHRAQADADTMNLFAVLVELLQSYCFHNVYVLCTCSGNDMIESLSCYFVNILTANISFQNTTEHCHGSPQVRAVQSFSST